MIASLEGFLQFSSGNYTTGSFAMAAMSSAGVGVLPSLP